MDDQQLIEELKATAELYNKQLSATAALMLLGDLKNFKREQISKALAKCRAEIRTFPTMADILVRLDDGRPGPEEAWAMIPQDEEASVVWTEEMREAYGIARPLLLDDDPIAARMAFKESYTRLVADARRSNYRVSWNVSLGHSESGRAIALKIAVERGYIAIEHAKAIVPEIEHSVTKHKQLSVSGLQPVAIPNINKQGS